MGEVFLTIVRMGLVSGYVVLVVLLVRHLLRRFPKRYSYLLWSVVFLRLVCPVGIESPFSLIPDALFMETSGEQDAESGNFTDSLQATLDFRAQSNKSAKDGEDGKSPAASHRVADSALAGSVEYADFADSGKRETEELEKFGNYMPSGIRHGNTEGYLPEKQAADNENLPSDPLNIAGGNKGNSVSGNIKGVSEQTISNIPAAILSVLGLFWIAGMLVFWLVWAHSIRRFRKKLVGAVRVEEGVYETGWVTASFVDGIFHPVIYLAPGLSGAAREYVLCHERVHISRKDPQIKAAALLLVSIYWFHPLIWLAFRKMCEDMEMSCDERVVERLGTEIKKEYSNTLLKMAQGTDGVGLLAAFGGNEVKSRVKNVLSYRKPKNWLAILLLLLVVVVGIGLGLNPGRKDASAANGNGDEQLDPDDANVPGEEDSNGKDSAEKENSGREDAPGKEMEDLTGKYDSILASYHTALKEEWGAGTLVEGGFSSLATYCYGEDTLEKIGYAFLDLDGDGVEELLIGAIGGDDFIKQQIFELYSLKDDVPTRVFSGMERDRYYLSKREDGSFIIANEGSSAASNSVWNYYEVREGQIALVQTVVYDGQADEMWLYAAGEDAVSGKLTAEEEEAKSIIKGYEEERTVPEYIPFSDFERSRMGEVEGKNNEAEDERMGKKVRGKYLEDQLDLILSQKEIWEQTDDFVAEDTKYTVVDLNGNGRLELIAASCQGTGHYTYANIYEVSEDGNSLVHYTHTVPEGDSQADIIWGVAPVYYNEKENIYRYVFDDLIRDGAAHYYEGKKSLELKANQILETTLAYRITEYVNTAPVVTYGSEINGMRVTNEQEYESAADKTFEGWQKGMAYFLWFIAPEQREEEEDIKWLWYQRLQTSYRSFSVVFEYSNSLTRLGQEENVDVKAEFLQSWKDEAKKEGYREADALEWYEKFQRENVPLEMGDKISALCLDDYDGDGVTDCFLAVSKYGDSYDAKWDGSPHAIVWGNINGKFCKIALWEDPVIALVIVAGDVNHDGFTELVIRGDTGACGLSAIRPHWMFSLHGGEIQEMKLPSQRDYDFGMGIGCYEISVYPTEDDSICRAVLKQDGREALFTVFEEQREEDYTSKLDEAVPGWRDNEEGFGGNGGSYFDLEVITQDGREYLVGREYLFMYAVGGALGRANLVFDWDENGDAYVKDFYVEPSV